MGQYFKVVYKHTRKRSQRTFHTIEHLLPITDKMMGFYLCEKLCQAVAAKLARGKLRLATVGDYADDADILNITSHEIDYDKVWGKEAEKQRSGGKCIDCYFNYEGKFLVNYTKKVYISFDIWMEHYKRVPYYDIPCPFVVLTAIGNGKGMGDYNGTNMDKVGSWAWDELAITEIPPKGFELEDFCFTYIKKKWF